MTTQRHPGADLSHEDAERVQGEGRGEIGAVKRFSARLYLAESVILELSERVDRLEEALDGTR